MRWLLEHRHTDCTAIVETSNVSATTGRTTSRTVPNVMLAIESAAAHGHLTMVRLLCSHLHIDSDDLETTTMETPPPPCGTNGLLRFALIGAAANGQLEVAKWLFHRESGHQCAVAMGETLADALRLAVSNCHVAVCRWICGLPNFSGALRPRDLGAEVVTRGLVVAAQYADFGMLEWVREQSASFDANTVMEEAVRHGQLEVAQWLLSEHPPGGEASGCTDAATPTNWTFTPQDHAAFVRLTWDMDHWRIRKWLNSVSRVESSSSR